MASSESITNPGSIASSEDMSSARSWLFRVLTIAGGGLLVYTWFQPWWAAYLEALQENGVTIFPYKMVIAGTLRDYPQWITGAEMPAWFFPLMWVYLAVMLGVISFSMFVTDEDRIRLGKINLSLPKAMLGFAGLAYIIYVVVFVIVISIRAPAFYGVQLMGNVFISMNEHTESYVITTLQQGYWLACVVGPLLVVLAMLRSKIIGKS